MTKPLNLIYKDKRPKVSVGTADGKLWLSVCEPGAKTMSVLISLTQREAKLLAACLASWDGGVMLHSETQTEVGDE